jgi:hypothetical protein
MLQSAIYIPNVYRTEKGIKNLFNQSINQSKNANLADETSARKI